MKLIIFVTLFFSYSAVCSELSSDHLYDLEKNWLLNEPKSYQYTLRHGVGPFGSTLEKIVIRDGICTARSRFIFHRRHHRWEKSSCEGHRINNLIASIRTQESAGVFKSKMRTNEKYGFVSEYYADPKTDATDQDWHFEVSDFKVNKSQSQG